jgi:hypothetical protein
VALSGSRHGISSALRSRQTLGISPARLWGPEHLNNCMTEQKTNVSRSAVAPGIAVFGCFATGLLAWFGALWSLSRDEAVGGGICLLAGAVAFGVVVYVSFRD